MQRSEQNGRHLFSVLQTDSVPHCGQRTFGKPLDHYRLQKVMSKATSRSQGRGRRSPSGEVKRMFSAYLLALISGM